LADMHQAKGKEHSKGVFWGGGYTGALCVGGGELSMCVDGVVRMCMSS